MGGKSTFLKTNSCFNSNSCSYGFNSVPAKSASVLDLVDRVFARIGASDDLIEGESTFHG